MRSHSFKVIGLPAPQGSKRHVGNGILIESSKKVKPWREAVKWSFCEHPCPMFEGPCEIELEFYLPRPKSAKKSDTRPSRKPDIDKLIRSTFDGLVEARAVIDDSRFVSIKASKFYAKEFLGALITISSKDYLLWS